MAISVAFRNPQTGEMKQVKVGFSWVLFFFSGFFGIPLFLRKLNAWGWVMVSYNIANLLFSIFLQRSAGATLFSNVCILVVLICLGWKGNEFTAKNYLARGWRFVEPNSDMTRYAKMRWHIFDEFSHQQAESYREDPSWDQRR